MGSSASGQGPVACSCEYSKESSSQSGQLMCSIRILFFYSCFTLASRRARVSSTAAFTFQLKRSPRIRMSGPVICTTDGCSASALVNLITSPRPCAACSFTSGSPLRMASRKIGRIGVMPCKEKWYVTAVANF